MTYDFGLDAPLLYKMVEDTKDHFNRKGLLGKDKLYSNIIGFGHLGDGVKKKKGYFYLLY